MAHSNSKVDIINLILKSQQEAFEHKTSQNKEVHITAQNFFTEENPGGPITKTECLTHMKSLQKSELEHLKAFFEKISAGEKVDANPFETSDQYNRNHIWAAFYYKKGKQNLKIYTIGELCKFIQMYQMGLLSVELSLESLYKEAERE